jgi:hypothetical protein
VGRRLAPEQISGTVQRDSLVARQAITSGRISELFFTTAFGFGYPKAVRWRIDDAIILTHIKDAIGSASETIRPCRVRGGGWITRLNPRESVHFVRQAHIAAAAAAIRPDQLGLAP